MYDILQLMKPRLSKTVLVAISSQNAASRQKLRGIYRYAARKDDWSLALVRSPADFTPQMCEECASGRIDGFILSSGDCSAEISRFVPDDSPIVAIEVGADIPSNRNRHKTLVFTTDNAAIGQMAASHFKALGRFASFAYIPDEMGREWSMLREKAFVSAVSSERRNAEVYDATRETLVHFLVRQKKPLAVFAAWDFLAAKVIRACREAGFSVPSQVSVLGVDDDDLICESVRPALSTILADRVKQGFMAAKALDSMMNSRRASASESGYVCRPLAVVERESTAYVSAGYAVVERARRFIEENAQAGICVDDVAHQLRISRRLLDLRFEESGLGSVGAFIREKKLLIVKRLLNRTALSDQRIAMRCGFKNVGSLRNLFRRTYGMSMSAYRMSLKG